MKPSKLKEHLLKMHPASKDCDLEHFQKLKDKYLSRYKTGIKSYLTPSTSKNLSGGLVASYNISNLIAKGGYPHTIGEKLIIPAMKEIITNVMKLDADPIMKSVSLSNSTVQRRIDELGVNVETCLINELRSCKFSVQLDESTFGSNAILMAYVRYYSISKEAIIEEFLFAEKLETYTTGEQIFTCFENFLLKHDIPLKNISSAASDGAPAMMGKYRGCLALIKNKVPTVIIMHCVLHRQHLVAKNLQEKLHRVLKMCIKAINTIKAKSLNARLFSQLCDRNEEMFNQLLLHTEVRWLSKGNCLQRLVDLFDSVVEFLLEEDETLAHDLLEFKKHIFYLTDIFSLFNAVQTKLQGRDVNLIDARTVLLGFCAKIELYINALNSKDYRNFDNLKQLSIMERDTITDADIHLFTNHLRKLQEDFNVRFDDLKKLDIPNWIFEPFESDVSNEDFSLQEEIIEMREDLEARSLFKIHGYSKFWAQKDIRRKYPRTLNIAEPIFLAFPSSYLVEAGFSHVNYLLRKERNRLDLTERGDLRLKLTNFEPNVNEIISTHQLQPSH